MDLVLNANEINGNIVQYMVDFDYLFGLWRLNDKLLLEPD